MLETLDAFPLRMFTYKVKSQEALTQLVNEINFKRPHMETVSAEHEDQNTDIYVTDFQNPVELDNLEYIIHEMNQELAEHSMQYEKSVHWTALYKKGSHHRPHSHLLYTIDCDNYCGILYLTNEGGTNFYSPTPQSWESKFSLESSYGTIILFPSKLVHDVSITLMNETERCIVAFNGRLSFV